MTGFLLTTAMWMLMMVVMMLPAVFPWLKGFAAMSRHHGPMGSGGIRTSWVALFGLGYLAAWLGFSVVGATLQIGLRSWGLLGASALGVSAALVAPLAGLVLVGAGLYQVAPTKAACLEHCRTPMSYFLTRWRNGPGGAFRMGLSHGAFCVGCCWALMLTGFALGVMNLAWMAVLTAVIAVETLAPRGERIGKVAGAALVVWGLVLLTSA